MIVQAFMDKFSKSSMICKMGKDKTLYPEYISKDFEQSLSANFGERMFSPYFLNN